MAEPNEPDLVVAFILDESGTMLAQMSDTIKGYNEYIDKLKADHEGERILFSLTQFNSNARVIHNAELIEDIPHLSKDSYNPNNWPWNERMTALYDAIGNTITELSKRIDQDTNVLIVTMTDGLENNSKKFSLSQIKEMVDEKKKKEWSFVFMGADPTTAKVGDSLGAQASIQYSSANMSQAMGGMAAATEAYRGAKGMSAACRSAAYADAFRGSDGKGFDMDINREIDDEDVVEAVYDQVTNNPSEMSPKALESGAEFEEKTKEKEK